MSLSSCSASISRKSETNTAEYISTNQTEDVPQRGVVLRERRIEYNGALIVQMLRITPCLLRHMVHDGDQLDGAEAQQAEIAPHLPVLLPALLLAPRRHVRLLLHLPEPIHHTALRLISSHTPHALRIHHHSLALRRTLSKRETRLAPTKPLRPTRRHLQHLLHLPALQSAVPRDLRLTPPSLTHRHHPPSPQHVPHHLVEHELLRLQLQQRPREAPRSLHNLHSPFSPPWRSRGGRRCTRGSTSCCRRSPPARPAWPPSTRRRHSSSCAAAAGSAASIPHLHVGTPLVCLARC